jgi:hypothetical protein
MNICELLQTDFWSKRRSRKILTTYGITFAALVLAIIGSYEVELHWLTPGERNASKAALAEVDLLQNAGSMNGKDFDLQEERAQLKFGVARDLIRTRRDKEIVAVLSYYFISSTQPWDQARFDLEYPVSSDEVDADRKSELKSWISESGSRRQLRALLHKELD